MIDFVHPDYGNTPGSIKRPDYPYSISDENVDPVISIITPFYNTGEIFRETRDCILRQTCQNFEWILVDDGSDEAAGLHLLAELERKDNRVKILRQSNQGPAVARNKAAHIAKAKYLFLIDADDLVEPTFMEKCIWFLESHPEYGFCNTWSLGFGEINYLWSRGFEVGEQFLNENGVSLIAVIRREVHLQAGGFDETIRHGHEDWDYWLNLADHGYWGYTIQEHLAWYRRHAGSRISETQNEPDREEVFRKWIRDRYLSRLKDRFPHPISPEQKPYELVPTDPPFRNNIDKQGGVKRILMILPWLVMGGADKFNLDLVEQLSGRGYEITVCTTLPSDNPWYAEFARFTPDIFHLSKFLKLTDYPRFLLYLIHSRQIDIVFLSNSYLGYQLVPFLRAFCPHLTLVDYNHMEEEYWRNGGYPRAAGAYQDLLDLNIVSTNHLKQWLLERGHDPRRIEVCYINVNPILWDPSVFSKISLRSEFDIAEDITVLLYAGRICEQKRPHLFAQVMRRLAGQKELNFTCIVAGEGPDLPELRLYVQQNNLERQVRFLGTVHLDRMLRLQALADIFFLPSQMEGLSMAIYEAMAMESVPVGADVGGQSELVTPECGYLIPHGEKEIDEYVRVLRHLIESPAERERMAKAGRERITTHFRLDQMVDRMIELLNKAQSLALSEPRPAVSKGLGLEFATQALELARVEKALGYYWMQSQKDHKTPDFATKLDLITGPDKSINGSLKTNLKILGNKLARQPGLRWLYRYRDLGKKFLGKNA